MDMYQKCSTVRFLKNKFPIIPFNGPREQPHEKYFSCCLVIFSIGVYWYIMIRQVKYKLGFREINHKTRIFQHLTYIYAKWISNAIWPPAWNGDNEKFTWSSRKFTSSSNGSHRSYIYPVYLRSSTDKVNFSKKKPVWREKFTQS